ncbi:polysaccharide lyase family 8 super-sandwich domain-containing protein [Paenibacillus soyae]|uniref:DNRLRE domain-containing protein n=1 Tax=Paenibacillus soyae TaxID=2969249 RepID=A0A9X2S9A6_9BACL|nr:polysaccharide lyase family 8 super-sandwich domain-containing protein [Paenibacillus soyae]MCR2805264.1 DNRLRE domain-containing protein [Paenibacillus soyae]
MLLCLSMLQAGALAGPPSSAVQAQAAGDEFDTLREKWVQLLFGASAYTTPVTDAELQSKLNAIAGNVTSCASAAPCAEGSGSWDLLNRDTANRTYLWRDNDFTGTDMTAVSGHMTNSYNRLLSMITAYKMPGSALQGNQQLKNDVISALDWLYANKYNETVTPYGNWFHWQIGTPQALTKITALMYNDLTQTQITNYMNAVNRFIPDPYARTVQKSTYPAVNQSAPPMTGANLSDQAYSVALRGIIVKDGAKIGAARDSLSDIFPYVTSGDGFYEDGSFIQHGNFPYIGGYGSSLLGGLGQLLSVLEGSTWSVTDPRKTNVYRWIFDAVEPLMYGGNIMDMVRGRNIAFGPAIVPLDKRSEHPALTGAGLISAILYLIPSAPTTNAAIGSGYPANPRLAMQSMVKQWLLEDSRNSYMSGASVYLYLQAKSLMQNTSVPARGELVMQKQYPNMDRAVQLRPGFGFGLSMSSSRIANYESGNNNNIQGWYTGDGMTYLYNEDPDQYVNYWPTVNRYRLPGTTVDTQTRTNAASWTNYVSPNAWVGGAELLGLYGASGMDFKASGDRNSAGTVLTPSNLTARKSWFMFDDEIVALGAGITNSGQTGNGWDGAPRRVETVIDNRKLTASGTNALTVNGAAKPPTLGWSQSLSGTSWIHLQGNTSGNGASIGYYFPQGTTVQAVRESRTGTWHDINTATPTTVNAAATADAYVRSGEANQGANAQLVVKNDSGHYARESYLTFDLSGIVPDNTQISGATIQLTPTSKGPTANAITHKAELVDASAWTESGITWSSKPSSTALSPAQQWSTIMPGAPVTINVTSAVQQALASGSKTVSIRVYASSPYDSDSYVYYASKEHPNSTYRPKLVLTGYKEMLTENYMTLTMNHGTNPSNASYAYALLPGKSPAEVGAYAANAPIEVLSNTASLQAVKETTLNAVGANFWTDGTNTLYDAGGAPFLTSNKKASVMTIETAGAIDIALSDPTMLNTGTIELEIHRSAASVISKDPTIAVTQFGPTIKITASVGGARGKTHHIKLALGTPPQTTSIEASADAFVRDGSYANTNYGTTNILEVKADGAGYARQSYIQFDLAALSGPVTSAKLRLTVTASGMSGMQHQANLASSSWTETGLTWSNKPAAIQPLASWNVPAAGMPVEIDVTAAVNAAVAGSKKLALEILSASASYGANGWAQYASRSHQTVSSRPSLILS